MTQNIIMAIFLDNTRGKATQTCERDGIPTGTAMFMSGGTAGFNALIITAAGLHLFYA